jgi:hypothetical protein
VVAIAGVVARVAVFTLLAPALWHRADTLGALVECCVELMAAAVEIAEEFTSTVGLAGLVIVDVRIESRPLLVVLMLWNVDGLQAIMEVDLT